MHTRLLHYAVLHSVRLRVLKLLCILKKALAKKRLK